MNKVDVACEILKVEAHLSLCRAAMLQDRMPEYLKQLSEVSKGITKLMEETLNEDMTRALVTK